MLDFSQDLSAQTPLVHPTSHIQNCTLGRYVEIGDHCVLEETAVGDYTYCFGSNDVIYTTLGKFNSIATGVRISPVQHPAKTRAAAHHFTYRCSHYGFGPDDEGLIQWRRETSHVTTGNDVWIGHNAVVMGGVPARHIGWRYAPEVIAAMERIRWWDWSHETLKERLRDFDDVERFCARYDIGQK